MKIALALTTAFILITNIFARSRFELRTISSNSLRHRVNYKHEAETIINANSAKHPSEILIHAGIGREKTYSLIARGGSINADREIKRNRANKVRETQKYAAIIKASIMGILISSLIWKYRETLAPFFDKKLIQTNAQRILEDLEKKKYSLLIYACGIAGWEFLGLSTIPVETAAGMTFGWSRAVIASGIGKLMGAYTAFLLGRSVLADWVKKKMQNQAAWKSLERSVDIHSPFQVALLMKYSCFPETIKNFGSSCLSIPFWMFAIATIIHGIPFTMLWTYLGVDSANRLRYDNLPVNRPLQGCLIFAALIGLVGSPLLMTWWLRDLKRHIDKNDAKDDVAPKNEKKPEKMTTSHEKKNSANRFRFDQRRKR